MEKKKLRQMMIDKSKFKSDNMNSYDTKILYK